jgi:hypothetical protein
MNNRVYSLGSPITALSLSPDRQRVLVAGRDGVCIRVCVCVCVYVCVCVCVCVCVLYI